MKKQYFAAAMLFGVTSITYAASNFNNVDICKAAISVEMGRDVNTMKSINQSQESPEIQYRRAADGQQFRYNCKFNGNRVVWRTYFNDQVSRGWGRWRESSSDTVITYQVTKGILVINASDTGESTSFKKSEF